MNTAQTTIVGVDCATNPVHVGLALGHHDADGLRIDEATTRRSWPGVHEQIGGWVSERTLLCLDAPLGWPAPLAAELANHQAGAPIAAPPNEVFRRVTDRAIAEHTGKLPLDVGADRIARTAHGALTLLQSLRDKCGLPIPLAWTPGNVEGVAAIEVYPAATLKVRALPDTRYKSKKPEAAGVRADIIRGLAGEAHLGEHVRSAALASDHVLDAVVCVFAGGDYLAGHVLAAPASDVVRHEGWIWVRRRSP